MKIKLRFIALPALLIVPLLAACGTYPASQSSLSPLSDGRYDSEFPYSSSSKQLEEIGRSIKLVTSIGYYNSYIFDEEMKFTAADIKKTDLKSKASRTIYYNNTSSGTAIVIHSQGRHIALLTCAHVVNFPDTVITYYYKEGGALSPFIQSISVKVSQSNFVPDIPERGFVEILVMDVKNDIALIGKTLNSVNSNFNIPEFSYPIGRARELEWGDFVYVFGFPMNYKMISKGIVSSPDREGGKSFLIDAVFNRGFSGGAVLAIRDGVPNFELVGLVRSVPAESEYLLRPLVIEPDIEINPQLPYKGDFAVEKRQSIKFGITKVIGIEAVLEFFNDNRGIIERKGFYINRLSGN